MVEIHIPNPQELHHYVTDLAARDGDKTQEELHQAIDAWMAGETSMPGEALWDVAMDGFFISRYELILKAGYSVEQGPWGMFVSLLWIANRAMSWQIVERREHLCDTLRRKGLTATIEVDERHGYAIQIAVPIAPFTVLIGLGHATLDEALAHGEEDAPERGNTPLVLEPGDGTLSFDLATCTRQLVLFQAVAPQAIDALYEVFGLAAPKTAVVVDLAHATTIHSG